jgi:DNA-directed RNA polymerase specialized sigma24 family protein
MNAGRKTRVLRVASPSRHATKGDFCRIFTEQVGPLYRLALLLTGSSAAAERCFIAALDECVRTQRIAIEKTYFRAKRAVMQNAIRILQLHFSQRRQPLRLIDLFDDSGVPRRVDERCAIGWLLSLPDFDRVVFVMSILEQYSEAACAFLLCCSLEDVRSARSRALMSTANSSASRGHSDTRPVHAAPKRH